jgi:hypothetical protein
MGPRMAEPRRDEITAGVHQLPHPLEGILLSHRQLPVPIYRQPAMICINKALGVSFGTYRIGVVGVRESESLCLCLSVSSSVYPLHSPSGTCE